MLTLKVVGPEQLSLTVAKLDKAFDQTDLLDQAGALLLARIRARFLQQTAPDGTKWVESGAAKQRRASGRDGGTGYDSGNLFHSIQLHTEGADARAISTDAANKKGVQYGPFFQYGTIKMPPRIFLGVNDDDAHTIESFLLKRFSEALP